MKKFDVRPCKVNAEVLGLDLHKEIVVGSRLDRSGSEIATPVCITSRERLEALLDTEIGRRKTHVAFEASGCSWWVYDLLVKRYGPERVHVAQPKRIRAIANSQEKNDANDAFWLAYLTHEGRLPEAYIPTGALRELRLATRQRQEAVRMRSRTVLRIKSLLSQMGERMPTRRGDSDAASAFLQSLAARTPGVLGEALADLGMQFEFLQKRVEAWDTRIEGLAAQQPDVLELDREVPGVGKVLAATIVAEGWPVRRFGRAKAFGRFTGLTPSERSSGGRTHHGGIIREGSRYLRWALTQAVMACTRAKDGPGLAVARWVQRHERRMGKAKARVAAARKLAELIWRLFNGRDETFDAAKPFGGKVAAPATA